MCVDMPDREASKEVIVAPTEVDQLEYDIAEGRITPPKKAAGLTAPVRQRSSKLVVDVVLEDRCE